MFTFNVFIQMIKFCCWKRTFLTCKNTFRNDFVTLRNCAVRWWKIWHIRLLKTKEFSMSTALVRIIIRLIVFEKKTSSNYWDDLSIDQIASIWDAFLPLTRFRISELNRRFPRPIWGIFNLWIDVKWRLRCSIW